ncbi:MAG: DNA-binding protein WhiA [Lachnospiraceae bacterium]|nr:DNA-binding protein WhiA [Lachnospiraceae bacterium]
MSFYTEVKDEAALIIPADKHCKIAELSAFFAFYAKHAAGEGRSLLFSPENEQAYRKCFTLLTKAFNIETEFLGETTEGLREYTVFSSDMPEFNKVMSAVSLNNSAQILARDCCRRAFLRGAFLSAGFIADPNTGYHFEITVSDEAKANLLIGLFEGFEIKARKSVRKKQFVVYIKESEAISDVLNVIGAHKAMLSLVEARIVKDVRNDVNRRNNFDTANITKAVNAASRQIEDISYIRQVEGVDNLPESLREIAEVRIAHPEASLTELGGLLDPPVGKSGVNHRLRKLSEYADALRGRVKSEKT